MRSAGAGGGGFFLLPYWGHRRAGLIIIWGGEGFVRWVMEMASCFDYERY